MLTYVIDPHPHAPDLSPYSGDVWEFEYSKFRQARTFDERVSDARNVTTDGVFDQVLVDWLTPRNASGNNAVWCDWGPAPNSGWLIAQDSTVRLAQAWFEENEMDTAMGELARATA